MYFNASTSLAPRLNSKNYTEVLDLAAVVKSASGDLMGNSLTEALVKPEVKELIRNNSNRYHEVLLTAQLPASQGGGLLRLVVLDQRQGNLAYNHIELTTLLKVNPELANEIGFYRVEGNDNLVWTPDIVSVNHRLKKLAQKYGYSDSIWSYEAATGVVDTMPYLKMLQKGKFPFSGIGDINLSVHDSMHAVAFAVLNITAGGREVLAAAKSRTKVILRINERLKNEVDGYYSNKFINAVAKYLSSDAMERTMLLTIVLTGNHDYFSASNVRSDNNGLYFTKQNKETTLSRIAELLKLFNFSHKTFEEALNQLAPAGDPNHEKIKKIFIKEIKNLKSASLAEIKSATEQIIKFMPDEIFGDNVSSGSTKNSNFENHDPAGAETLQAE